MKFEARRRSQEDQFADAAAKSAEAEHGDKGVTTGDDQASGAQHHGEQEDASDPWDDPDWTILDDRRGELPEFPTDIFADLCQHWLEGAAHGAGVTPAHVAVPLLAVASGLVGTGRRIRATQSWSQPMTLWMAVVGFSGSGKTSGIDVTKNALSCIEKLRASKIADCKHNHDEKTAAAKAAQKKWREEVESSIFRRSRTLIPI
jgi:hypothetical protein